MNRKEKNIWAHVFLKHAIVCYFALFITSYVTADIDRSDTNLPSTADNTETEPIDVTPTEKFLTINKIVVEGNKYVKPEAILHRIPYKKGQSFNPETSTTVIKNLYDLGSFKQIRLEGESIDSETMNLYIVVEEKKLIDRIDFKGNKVFRTKQIKEKLNLDKLTSIDEETLHRIGLKIQKMYREENRHLVTITSELVDSSDNPDKAVAIITINEGPHSRIKHVNFIGNMHMPDRKLAGIIFTRENWLLNFMDGAGAYNEEMLEMDKHRIEYFYRDHGYITAKVAKVQLDFSDDKSDISVTFHIKEGPQFYIRSLHVVGDEVHGEDELLPLVTLERGYPFSQTKLVQTLNKIKDLYGERGYINCDVYPQVKPDELTNEVDVTFHVERGNKLYVNRINITGNTVTRDKVVRRELEIAEGDLITTKILTRSQANVEYLSFFDRESVEWRIHRLSDELADLELTLKEAKTGNFNFMMTYGTDQYNPTPSMRAMFTIEKSNLCGKGWDVGGLVQADRHRFRRVEAHFADAHIFDSDIYSAFSFYKRWDDYDQWKSLDKTPRQKITGGHIQLGFWLAQIDKRLKLLLDVGIEDIRNNNPQPLPQYKLTLDPVIKRTFQEGTLQWFGLELVKDTRDHQVYPKNGYKLTIGTRLALPGFNKQFSFIKGDAEGSYYTALIDKFILDDSLVLALHGKLGTIQSFSGDRPIPYKELYHMGGQTTVRGFTWGGIGPAWITGDPLGSKNALLFNAELIFPLVPDYSMKAHVFYDTGAGWNTPKNDIPSELHSRIKRDKFDIRHSVGFGLNLVKPMPAKIDWGFKLDRRKKEGESPHEFHLSMNYAW